MTADYPTAEHKRIAEADAKEWRKWGPYLSDRAWATVREDYSENGDAWNYFPHEHARMRAFRWGEDGIGGFCDNHQNLCMSLAFWNGHDPILKERLFGLTNTEGNHGEDPKELYYYLDCTPTNSYARMLYRYPQNAYPYGQLIERNRGRAGSEWELFDELSADFAEGKYFDITIEYCKADPNDIMCRITAKNCGSQPAELHIIPQICYRNFWSWPSPSPAQPQMIRAGDNVVRTASQPPHLEPLLWYVQAEDGSNPELMFTNNETNNARLGWPGGGKYFKDAFNAYIIQSEREHANQQMRRQTIPADWINPDNCGSKVGAHFTKTISPGGKWEIRVRLTPSQQASPFSTFSGVFDRALTEANDFYSAIQPKGLSDDQRNIQRQAFAGLMWSKQYYKFDVEAWLSGDPTAPRPPFQRNRGRNSKWRQFDASDVIMMPDAWEYPWFAAWDLGFHCVAASLVDSEFAKSQLLLLLREYYMHPNGQVPAYEWEFSDVNPPVTTWAALQIYRREKRLTGKTDTNFLERIFQKQLLNFTWWVNREDTEGDNLFEGGFLGLDNISIIDRSSLGKLKIEQADASAWVAMFCANMMGIAIELAQQEPEYEDMAIKFLDHFTYIARAMVKPNTIDESFEPLWDKDDHFFYDHLYTGNNSPDIPLKIRSLVGLIPLLAVEVVEADTLNKLPEFAKHWNWLLENKKELLDCIAPLNQPGQNGRYILSLFKPDMLREVVNIVMDENRLLSPFGLRSLSKEHQSKPFSATIDGQYLSVNYAPGEADCNIKGGNSNWRGPVWMPANFLIISALLKHDEYHGGNLKVTLRGENGSSRDLTLTDAANELAARARNLFLKDKNGNRPIFGGSKLFSNENWRDSLLFHEYFHADNGKGLGANHQTGWTALIANLIQWEK